ncbi:unnamed protein product [Cuscuta europaea]|uniref:Retrovirus-related Pol polyprotein from transposon TNT 1-94-like beta-barrel domain-containing protein n=1 Tax=Cuscuta europaea TaxID=41803 RepID=A0A9P0YK18_CUSEU|nr:unnamed protein product [Cuscuta europaea]
MNGTYGPTTCIIDKGVTNHIYFDRSILFKLEPIKSCSDALPDRQKVLATGEGCVNFADGLGLKHVLFVPQMTCNLISVTQLSDEMDCFVQFLSSRANNGTH